MWSGVIICWSGLDDGLGGIGEKESKLESHPGLLAGSLYSMQVEQLYLPSPTVCQAGM